MCPFGHRLVGSESIKCGPEGEWTGEVPKCEGERVLHALQLQYLQRMDYRTFGFVLLV